MARHVVRRNGRAGQDELTRTASGRVNRPANLIPDRWHELPLVDQPWPIPFEKQCRCQKAGRACFVIDVEAYLAGGCLPGGFCLATAAGALDHHRPGCGEARRELSVSDPRAPRASSGLCEGVATNIERRTLNAAG